MGALRETAKNLGKKHDFVSTRIVLPHVCDYSKEVCHFEMYVCQQCGYRAHKSCYLQVPPTCSPDKVVMFLDSLSLLSFLGVYGFFIFF